MGCNTCGKKAIVNTRVRLGNHGEKEPTNPEHNLEGRGIITTDAREGTVSQNVVNTDGVVVGYIVEGIDGSKFSIFRNQIFQKK